MALTTLTGTATFDAVRAPNNGTKIVAVSVTDPPPADDGPVRPSLQALTNRDEFLKVWRDAMIAGTTTLKSLAVDGVGEQVFVPTPGNISASGDIATSRSLRAGLDVGGTTTPTTKVDPGEMPRSLVPVGWIRMDGSRAMIRGVNVYDVDAGIGAGVYRVTFDRVLGSTNCAPMVQLMSTSARLFTSCFVDTTVGGRCRVTVSIFDKDGVGTDPGGLALTLFGE